MKQRDYVPQMMRIAERTDLTPETVGLRLEIPKGKSFSFNVGQFVMLSVLGFGEVPIGITTSPDEKGYIEVAVRSVGMVTQKICSLSEGDEIGVSGPFGNGFPITKIKGRDVVIISGGIGLAPLRSLIRHHLKNPKLFKSLTILSGARNPELLMYADEYKDWSKSSEVFAIVDTHNKDWKGPIGNITALFDRAKVKRGSVIIVCGPPVMFKPVVDRFGGKSVAESDIYLLLERNMKCGIGKCQHCTCGNYYACTDGPVFSYDKIKYNKEAFA